MEQLYSQYRRLLMSLAYQLTGSFSDAEDVVQDVFLKAYDAKPLGLLEAPQAYLCKMVANRCRDLHRSARKRKESYFGEWLPEPIPTSEDEAFEIVARDELLSYATLVLLERLSPAERAAFVLREALGFEYEDIAAILEKTEANSRKLFSRAKGKLGAELPDPGQASGLPPAAEEAMWIHRFLGLLREDKIDEVLSHLASDVVLISDGGGKASAAVKPIASPIFVARFLLGVMSKSVSQGAPTGFKLIEVNGRTGLLFHAGGQVDTVALFHVTDHRIRNIYLIRNPDKLALFAKLL